MTPWEQFTQQLTPQQRIQAKDLHWNEPLIGPDTQLNFEQRVLYPSRYPVINNPDGSWSTHKMMWGGGDGRYVAYPKIVQDGDGNLVELDPKEAYAHAMANKEYRVFASPEAAQSYAEGGYKRYWGRGDQAEERNRTHLASADLRALPAYVTPALDEDGRSELAPEPLEASDPDPAVQAEAARDFVRLLFNRKF